MSIKTLLRNIPSWAWPLGVVAVVLVVVLFATGGDDESEDSQDGVSSPVSTQDCIDEWNDQSTGPLATFTFNSVTQGNLDAYVGPYSGAPVSAKIPGFGALKSTIKNGQCVVAFAFSDQVFALSGGDNWGGYQVRPGPLNDLVLRAAEQPNAIIAPGGGGRLDLLTTTDESPSATVQDESTEDAPLASPTETEVALLTTWQGDATFTRAGEAPQTYRQVLEISSLDAGRLSGRATADYPDGFHCGGSIRFVDGEDGNFVFDYKETDNLDGCAPTSRISVTLDDPGQLVYREISDSGEFKITGTLSSAAE